LLQHRLPSVDGLTILRHLLNHLEHDHGELIGRIYAGHGRLNKHSTSSNQYTPDRRAATKIERPSSTGCWAPSHRVVTVISKSRTRKGKDIQWHWKGFDILYIAELDKLRSWSIIWNIFDFRVLERVLDSPNLHCHDAWSSHTVMGRACEVPLTFELEREEFGGSPCWAHINGKTWYCNTWDCRS
jgi:hypothetical protein